MEEHIPIPEGKRALFAKKSERVVPIDREIATKKREVATPEKAADRKEAARQKRSPREDARRAKRRSRARHPWKS